MNHCACCKCFSCFLLNTLLLILSPLAFLMFGIIYLFIGIGYVLVSPVWLIWKAKEWSKYNKLRAVLLILCAFGIYYFLCTSGAIDTSYHKPAPTYWLPWKGK
jgi:hypothetical protein